MWATRGTHKARERLPFWTGLGVRTSDRARELSSSCRVPLAWSLLQRRQPPAFLQTFSDFWFFQFRDPINGRYPLPSSLASQRQSCIRLLFSSRFIEIIRITSYSGTPELTSSRQILTHLNAPYQIMIHESLVTLEGRHHLLWGPRFQ